MVNLGAVVLRGVARGCVEGGTAAGCHCFNWGQIGGECFFWEGQKRAKLRGRR